MYLYNYPYVMTIILTIITIIILNLIDIEILNKIMDELGFCFV